MIATKPRPRAAAPLSAGFAVSTALHAALVAAVAAIPAGVLVAQRAPAEPDRPFAAAWVAAPAAAPEIVVTLERQERSHVPPPQPETIEMPEWTADVACPAPDLVPEGPATPPPTAEGGPAPAGLARLGELAAIHPGRGSGGRGTIGVGGSGGGGDGGGTGGGGGTYGALGGVGAGGDGPGSGWAARGGETRGPAVVGQLPAPAYPAKARSRGWEGRVVLVLTIDEHGRVTSADVAESSGRPDLDDAAREAALAWTLSPALHDGEPVAGTLRVPVRFELTD